MSRVYLPCDGLDCPCQDHVDTDTHVPVCPIHGFPLHAGDDPSEGVCPLLANLTCSSWSPSSWVWKRRDLFDSADLPPYNGWRPVDLTAAGVSS